MSEKLRIYLPRKSCENNFKKLSPNILKMVGQVVLSERNELSVSGKITLFEWRGTLQILKLRIPLRTCLQRHFNEC